MKMVLFPPVSDDDLRRLRAAAEGMVVVNAVSDTQAQQEIAHADAFYGKLTPLLLQAAGQLRWVQAPQAGLEHYVFPGLAQSDLVLTNMRGVYNDHIADHAFGLVLLSARGFHTSLRQQQRREWNPQIPIVHLADSTLGVIGLGGIGEEVARRAKTSEMRVVAVDPRRTEKPSFVDELWDADHLNTLLVESDFVVICAPHTPQTEKMIRAEQLARMKPTAFLINIGRGVIVDLTDLTQALEGKKIAGAGLDVFETEPLPADHPLWLLPNVVITPHMAGNAPHNHERRLRVLLENAGRWARGEPLRNVVDKAEWF